VDGAPRRAALGSLDVTVSRIAGEALTHALRDARAANNRSPFSMLTPRAGRTARSGIALRMDHENAPWLPS
jgi:hypothetical protein